MACEVLAGSMDLSSKDGGGFVPNARSNCTTAPERKVHSLRTGLQIFYAKASVDIDSKERSKPAWIAILVNSDRRGHEKA